MSQTIDHRVVEMRFDNKQFESGAATTMSTLQKLKKSLDFSKVGDSFKNINKAANKVDMAGLDRTISGIHNKFSALEVMAITTLANITNSFVNSAKRWVSAFTFEPVRSGFQEYETQINAIQTILANTQKEGTNIKQVNAALDELNYYADKTIYNFTEMTRNIGTFTAAGVDLKTSVNAIQGIANLAAVSGSNSQQASVAMYQLSQALATGTIRLMDWNSVVNAGMGGQLFQDALIETSRLLGTGADAAIKAEGSFRDSLQTGWLTSEVLTETLKKFTTSGAIEYVSKYTGLSKEAIQSELDLAESMYGEADAIDKAAESLAKKSGKNRDEIAETLRFAKTAEDAATKVKTFSQLIDTLKEAVQSGWAQSFRIIVGDFEEAKKLFSEISDSFSAVISASADARNKLLSDVFEKRDGRELLIDSLRNSLKGLLSVINPVKEAFREVFPPATAEQIYGILKAFHEFTETLSISEKSSKNLKKAFKGVFDVVKLLGSVFVSLVKSILLIKDPVVSLSDVLFEVVGTIGTVMTKFSKWIREATLISKAYNVVKTAVEALVKVLGNLFNSLSKALDGIGFDNILSIFNVTVLVGIWKEISKFIENLNSVVDSSKGLVSNIKKIFSGVTDSLDELQTTLKSAQLKSVAVSIALLAGSIFLLSTIDPKKLNKPLMAVSVLLGEITGIFIILSKVQKNKKAAIGGLASLLSLSTSILVLSFALKKVSDVDSSKLIGSLKAISILLVEMTAISIILSSHGSKMKTGVVGIIAFSTAIYIMSSAIKKLGELDIDTLKKGLVSVGLLLAEISLFITSLNFGKLKTGQALSIVILSGALLVLQKAVEKFGGLDVDTLKKGLASVGVILAEISAFSLITGQAKNVFSTATNLIVMAKALQMLEEPIHIFGNMSISQIGKGLITMGGALTGIAIAMKIMPKNSLSIGAGLIAVANSIIVISDAVLKMGGMSWENIAKGMIVLAGSMTILAISMRAMSGTLGASASILILSGALSILSSALKTFGSMSFTEIAKGLAILAGSFTIIGIAGALLSPLIPAILGLSAALAIIGIAAATAGVGVLALSTGLSALSVAGVLGASSLVEALKILIVGFLNTISDSAESLAKALETLISVACDVLIKCVPKIVKTVFVVINEILTILVDNAPEIVSKLLKLIIAIIDSLADNIPTVIQSVVNLFMKFFSGLVSALKAIDTKSLLEGILALGLISGIMIALSAMASLAPSAMLGVLALGAVIAELALLLAAIGGIAQIPGLNWLIGEGGQLLQGVGIAIGKFVGGIIAGGISAIASQLPQIGSDLSSFMVNLQPFIMGSKLIDAGALASVGILAAIIIALTAAEVINGIASLFGLSLVDMAIELSSFMIALQPFILQSKQLKEDNMKACKYLASMIITLTTAQLITGIGRILGLSGSLSDFGKELSEFGPYIKKFASEVKGVKPEAVQGAASAAEIMANLAKKLPGTGGLAQKIFGEKSLSQFGNELVKFGPSIKKFGDQVKGVKPEAVQGAASAAEIMATVATKLPAQGGLVQKIFGEKSLSEFGAELVKFGPKISQFAEQVKNVKPEAVQGAASATKIMSNLANNLPNSETLWNKIFGGGQTTLSEFGDEIVKFGRSMSKFSEAVAGIDNEQVNGAVRSFKSLVNLAKSSEGVSATDLVNFSNQLANIGTDSVSKFVQAFTNAGPKATAAVSSLLNSVVRTLASGSSMVRLSAIALGNSLCTGIQNGISQKQSSVIATEMLLASSMTNTLRTALPISIFNTIGQNIVQGLINGINSKRPLTLSTVKNLCVSIINTFRSALPSSTFNTIGQNVIQGLINGINSKRGSALSAVGNLCSAIISKFRTSLPSSTFKNFGENMVSWIVQGMNGQKSGAIHAAAQISRSIVRAFDDNLTQSELYDIGSYAAIGLKYGIEDRINEIARAAAKAAKASVEAARRELDEHSPSKVTWKIGEFFSLGLANGIVDNIRAIAVSGSKVAEEAVNPVKKAVDIISDIIDSGDFDSDPVIRPVMDLSDVQQGVKDISSLMNRKYDLSAVYDKVMDTSSSFNRSRTSKANDEVVNSKSGEGNTFEFNQYNYSPKSLSRSEIYRQTNNQFSAFRRAVGQA